MLSIAFSLAAWWAAADPAFACSCAPGATATVPAEDGIVPLDASLLVAWPYEVELAYELVVEPSGEPVAIAVETWTEAETVWYRIVPGELLAPDADYLLRLTAGDTDYTGDELMRFRTGELDTDEAPPEVTLLELQGDYSLDGGSCGEGGRMSSKLRLGEHATAVAIEAEVSRSEDFEAVESITSGDDDYLWLGAGTCQTNIDSLVEDETVWVRARAVTLSGVAGPWTDPEQVKVGGSGGGGVTGCSQTGLAPGAYWLLPLLLVGRRRLVCRPRL